MNSMKPINALLKSRGTLIELALAAVVLALGVNLLSSAISEYFETAPNSMILLGGSLILLSISVIARRTLTARSEESVIEGFVCFRRETSQLINVPRYRFCEELSNCLKSLFSENLAPKKAWESDPIHKTFEHDFKTQTSKRHTTEAGKLLIEATEYFALDILSTHLTDYFNHSGLDSDRLKELSREDVGPIVFSNRFLDTFSRPMKERAGFVNQIPEEEDSSVFAVYGDLRFSRFDLVLPIGSKVSRIRHGELAIHAPKFTLTIRVDFDGFGANLPTGFSKLYLGERNSLAVSTYQIDLSIKVEFKSFSLLSRTGWQYHQWLDSFLQAIEKGFSANAFFNKIDWESAVTTARVIEQARLIKNSITGASETIVKG